MIRNATKFTLVLAVLLAQSAWADCPPEGFDAEAIVTLEQGSEVVQALEKQVWGDFYGELIDPWGVAWMFNIAAPDGWAKSGSAD